MQEKQRMEFEALRNTNNIDKLATEESDKYINESSREYRMDLYQNQLEDKEARINYLLDELKHLKNARDNDKKDFESLKVKYEKKKLSLKHEEEKCKVLGDNNQQLLAEVKVLKNEQLHHQDLITQINKTIKDKDNELLSIKIKLEEQVSKNELVKRELETYTREVKDMQHYKKANYYNMESVHSENSHLKLEMYFNK